MFRFTPGLLALLALLSCDTSPILRRISLTAQPALPTGRSEIIGSALRVSALGLETLAKGSRYIVWAVKDDGAIPLGDFRGSGSISVSVNALHGDASAVRTIRITEESSTGLPDLPSGRVRLEGPLGSALLFPSVSAAQAAAGGGEGRTEDNHLILRTSNLPPLPTGLSYAVWVRFPPPTDSSGSAKSALAGDDGGTEVGDAGTDAPDASTDLPDANETIPPDAGTPAGRDAGSSEPALVPNDPGMVLLGNLDESGLLDATFPYLLATGQEMIVTVTSARADPELVSPVRVLRGELKLPAKQAETTSHTH